MAAPTPGPGLSETQLVRIAARALAIDAVRASADEIAWVDDVIRLVAALRAAWEGNDRAMNRLAQQTLAWDDALRAARDERDQYAEELRYQRRNLDTLSRALWSAGHYDLSAFGVDELVRRIDAALAAPGAGDRATEEST